MFAGLSEGFNLQFVCFLFPSVDLKYIENKLILESITIIAVEEIIFGAFYYRFA